MSILIQDTHFFVAKVYKTMYEQFIKSYRNLLYKTLENTNRGIDYSVQVLPIITNAVNEITDNGRKQYSDLTMTQLFLLDSYRNMLSEFNRVTDEMTHRLAEKMHDDLQKNYKLGFALMNDAYISKTSFFDGKNLLMGLNFRSINLASEQLNSKTGLYNQLLRSKYPQFKNELSRAMLESIVLGENGDKAKVRLSRVTGYQQSRIRTLANDFIITVHRDAHYMSMMNNRYVIGYRRTAFFDKRTCISCISLHGIVYPKNVPFHKHPNCRCFPEPIFKGENTDHNKEAIEYLDSLSDIELKLQLGRSRYKYYKNGGNIRNFSRVYYDDKWGNQARVRTVKSLRNGGTNKINKFVSSNSDFSNILYSLSYDANQRVQVLEKAIAENKGNLLVISDMKRKIDTTRRNLLLQIKEEAVKFNKDNGIPYNPVKVVGKSKNSTIELVRRAQDIYELVYAVSMATGTGFSHVDKIYMYNKAARSHVSLSTNKKGQSIAKIKMSKVLSDNDYLIDSFQQIWAHEIAHLIDFDNPTNITHVLSALANPDAKIKDMREFSKLYAKGKEFTIGDLGFTFISDKEENRAYFGKIYTTEDNIEGKAFKDIDISKIFTTEMYSMFYENVLRKPERMGENLKLFDAILRTK